MNKSKNIINNLEPVFHKNPNSIQSVHVLYTEWCTVQRFNKHEAQVNNCLHTVKLNLVYNKQQKMQYALNKTNIKYVKVIDHISSYCFSVDSKNQCSVTLEPCSAVRKTKTYKKTCKQHFNVSKLSVHTVCTNPKILFGSKNLQY